MRGNAFDMKREKTQGGGESLFTVLEELHAALAQLASFPFPLWIGTSIQQQRRDRGAFGAHLRAARTRLSEALSGEAWTQIRQSSAVW